jgi:hypothetical protein
MEPIPKLLVTPNELAGADGESSPEPVANPGEAGPGPPHFPR